MCSSLKFLKEYKPFKNFNQGIISIWGDFGIGKTTLLLQILLINQLNKFKSIYIYTKPNFPYRKIESIFKDNHEEIIQDILFINCTDFDDLYNLIFNLEFLIIQHKGDNSKKIKLIVIDSLTDLYRLELDHLKKDQNFILNYKLNTILGNLSYLNKVYKTNILIVNEISKKSINGNVIEVESGGNVMDYWIQNSIKIERSHKLNERKLVIFNRSENIKREITITLTSNGFKD